jgi:hypothetical protein
VSAALEATGLGKRYRRNVAQDTPLYRDFTAAELLTMGGKLNRVFDQG